MRLQKANVPGVFIDEIGTTKGGRKLYIIRIQDPSNVMPQVKQKTTLLIAREHANEPASSWALYGAMAALMNQPVDSECRKGLHWLFVPILDQDGSAEATFDNLTERFFKSNRPKTPPEVLSYARYLTDYVNGGNTIDLAVSLHNVEASECENIFCPFQNMKYPKETIEFNTGLFSSMRQLGYITALPDKSWNVGFMTFRLLGWCAMHFNALDLAYEVNDRYPPNRLTLVQLANIGDSLSRHIGHWHGSISGEKWHQSTINAMHTRKEERAQYFADKQYGADERTPYDILTRGY